MAQKVLGRCEISTWPGSEEKLVTLPGLWYEHLKVVGQKDKVMLRAGNRKCVVEAVFTDEEEVQMTNTVRQALQLPLGAITAKAVNGHLYFGPFVGLYALPSKEPGKPFGELTAVFQDMFPLAMEEGVGLYVFIPGEVDWTEGEATAYVYKPREKHWVRTKRPLPDLVMPKIMGYPPEWKEQMRRDFAQFNRLVPYGLFNKATGNKWDVHQVLSQQEQTRIYLPDTRLVQSPLDVEEMLQRYRAVYIKPSYGTQGRSIYRLDLESGMVRTQYTSRGEARVKRIARGNLKWQHFLQKKFCGRRQFLIQKALDLVCTQGVRPVDFRWLVQKDGANCWQVTARVARVGGTGSITTNLHTGGIAVLAEEFLQQNGYEEEQVLRELLGHIDEAALQIATVLEHKAGRIGELGLDFGLTKQGEFYLIEVNPRPGRQMLKQTSSAVRALSLQRNLEYAKFTTGYE